MESNIEWVNEVMGTMASDRTIDIPHDNVIIESDTFTPIYQENKEIQYSLF